MKTIDYKQEAKQIVDDYYHLLNNTIGARYQTAKQYAIDMIQRRLETDNLHPDEKYKWFVIKQEMHEL